MAQCRLSIQSIRRPGILVLVNDMDWDLLDREAAQLKENDTLAFVSTLHGG